MAHGASLTTALVLLAVFHGSRSQLLEENRVPKAITQLNTLVVGPDDFAPVAATPTVTHAQLTVSSAPPEGTALGDDPSVTLSTKTIYGFLDFITTVGDTVMVFTPGAKTQEGDGDVVKPTRLPSEPLVSPTPTAPVIVSTTARVPSQRLRFTPAPPTPQPSQDVDNLLDDGTTSLPETTSQRGNNLWSHLRSRKLGGKRPFILPQRRNSPRSRPSLSSTPSLPTLSSIQARRQPSGPFQREFLSRNADSLVVPISSVVTAPPLRTSVVGLLSTLGGTEVSGDLTTVHSTSVIGTVVDGSYAQLLQSRSVIFSAPEATATVTRASSVIRGVATEFPALPVPLEEPEVLPLERLFTSLDDAEPSGDSGRAGSLQERLKARLRAALDARPSREVEPPAQRPPLLPEGGQRARASSGDRPFRPEIPLLPRRSFSGRQPTNRRLSATERLKQRLLQERQERPAPSATTERPERRQERPSRRLEEVELRPRTETTGDATAPQEEVVAVNTYRPKDATNYYYVLTTLRSLEHRTLGRYTNTQWQTRTETNTVTVDPTTASTRTPPSITSTALPSVPPLSPSTSHPRSKHGDAVMLPAVQLDPSKPSLPLKTMTETYSTTQLVLKSSVIPLVIGDSTKSFTLTQSYQVTRLVTALKTMPPMEVFRTAVPEGLLDRSGPLLGQGSENQVDSLGVPVLRVPPPDNLADIGAFDADQHERESSPEMYRLQQLPTSAPTPALPQLGALGSLAQLAQLTPQQLAMVHLLGPYLAALRPGLQQQQQQQQQAMLAAQRRTVVTSSPVFITTTVTTTSSRGIVVTFRASPSTAYITTTAVVSTVLTSYVTSTVQMPASFG